MAMNFEKASQKFLDSLRADGKAFNTIRNYSSDLETLGHFLKESSIDFRNLGLNELDQYHKSLKEQGLRPNSRRRKLMTAKTFIKLLSGTSADISSIGADKIIPPEKVEKPPKLVSISLIHHIAATQPETAMGIRNRALVLVLLSSGALVTEVLALKRTDVVWRNGVGQKKAVLRFSGKRARQVALDESASEALHRLGKELLPHQKFFFYGYNRGGPLAHALTARGVEVLFKAWSKGYKAKELKPRMLRHICVMKHLFAGRTEQEVMLILGLSTPYIFRLYRPLLEMASAELDELRTDAKHDAKSN